MTIEIETVEQLLQYGYSVSVWCPKCNYQGPELELNKYVLQGRGGMRPIELELKHTRCRTLLEVRIHPPKGYGK